ncbi:lysine--tRNA ligase [Litorivicinus lipolyticus]|uniref:Lysine--tRNA ligase n=1 Tax=Litorivicinus lipolyticus TaxID=418701 RepID=A0A5Q2QBU7_9GAMM|nr:lysine--tRNA ligase [Litorivicinus lipolyticus]QGG80763.1 lysine--tRNA ligase [Litorivicinus lipolyticus]
MSDKTPQDAAVEVDENQLIAERRAKLAAMREAGIAFPNSYRRDALASELVAAHGDKDKPALEVEQVRTKIAGRVVLRRIMGKASFITIQDTSGRIQAYLRKNDLPEGLYDQFKTWDLGDIVGVEGHIFKTNTGELSVHATDAVLLTKSLRPLPDKHKGLTDTEQRYRQRYLDLIANPEVKNTFVQRSQIVSAVRGYFLGHDYLEVETPMLQVIPGGATARPFATHHNALDIEMYLRIAPELYLKRLVVGGFERVFEINRNFRNEGLSTRHNPEFTMLEFYEAYTDVNGMIDHVEALIRAASMKAHNSLTFQSAGHDYDLSAPFRRISVFDSILEKNPSLDAATLGDLDGATAFARDLGIHLKPSYGLGKVQIEIFEKTVEDTLIEPTFITLYPAEVSPLARRNNNDPFLTDRFEFFVGGRELANGFSELNDAEDQAQRFQEQVAQKDGGDDEAMYFDEDYVTALEVGLPPTGGCGIGIDRLVMWLLDQDSIRDVILFPAMRPQA